ncbi:54S ribosomal L4, mitochondrial [Lecanosticta acicola]|uniref:Large ribosomal subunit protein uL29m n=1 Tax=Lecanosticta acicola TaxID=111012 RepID=A0AAI9EEZ7_9PEZI|nr:54S ribosomal L4, mitochondrial [Lecanosticta acicola]
MTMHCTTGTLLKTFTTPLTRRASTLPPSFLLPAFTTTTTLPSPSSSSSFSTTTPHHARKDGNPYRGVSPLHRSGLNKTLRKSPDYKGLRDQLQRGLPQPVLDQSKRSEVEVDEDHGLWEFLPPGRHSLMDPSELRSHGRAWTAAELRKKDWDDLHRLWWVCLKEANRLQTQKAERNRLGEMYGDYENDARMKATKTTMDKIRTVLLERWYAWENARSEAMLDEEVNMYAELDNNEQAYFPKEEQLEGDDATSSADGSSSSLPPPDGARLLETRV